MVGTYLHSYEFEKFSKPDFYGQEARTKSSCISEPPEDLDRGSVVQLTMMQPPSAPSAVLPPPLMALFAPRPPLPFLPPIEKPTLPPYSGVASLMNLFEDHSTADLSGYKPVETRKEKTERIKKERSEKQAKRIEEILSSWDPKHDPKAKGDPHKTLFVARITYGVSEDRLKKEFEQYGPIKRVRTVQDTVSGKPRGYAFIEFEHERDMREAYKYGNGKKVEGRRVVLDVERGRLDPAWRPRRLGGGLGDTRGKKEKDTKPREPERAPERRDERERGGDRDSGRRDDRDRDHRRDDRDRDRDRERDYRPREGDRDRDRDRDRDYGRRDDRDRYDRDRRR